MTHLVNLKNREPEEAGRQLVTTRKQYQQAYDDHSYLWSHYGSADDMTGGYVDQEDLADLLKSPNIRTAYTCLLKQIDWWFQKGTDHLDPDPDMSDPRLQEIAERYNVKDCWLDQWR